MPIKLPKLWNNGRLDDKTECIEWVMETPKKGQTFPAVRRLKTSKGIQVVVTLKDMNDTKKGVKHNSAVCAPN